MPDRVTKNKPTRTPIENFGRGFARGLGRTGTGIIGALGGVLGSKGLQDFAESSNAEMDAFYDPQSRAGELGGYAGRGAGELAMMFVPASNVARRAGKALAAAEEAAQLERVASAMSRARSATAGRNLETAIDRLNAARAARMPRPAREARALSVEAEGRSLIGAQRPKKEDLARARAWIDAYRARNNAGVPAPRGSSGMSLGPYPYNP